MVARGSTAGQTPDCLTHCPTGELDPATVSREEFIELRRGWDRFHAARNTLNFLGFAGALLGVLSESTDG